MEDTNRVSAGHRSQEAGAPWLVTELGITLLLAYLIWHFLHYRKLRGPIVWPVVGTVPQFLWNLPHMYDWTTDMLRKHDGTYTSIAPKCTRLTAVATCRPDNVEYVLKTNFANYPKGRSFLFPFHELLGNGIFNSDGLQWKTQRKIASLEFSNRSLRDLMVKSNVTSVKERLLPILADIAQRRVPIDLQDVLLRYTFDNICIVGFGVDPGCLAPGLPSVPFATAFDVATEATLVRMVTPEILWRTNRVLGWGMEGRLQTALQTVDKFASEVICARRKELALMEDFKSQDSHVDLLSRFMQMGDANGKPYTDTFLRAITTNFILAGRDTSAVALSWFFWLLTQHPSVEEKILEELRCVLQARLEDTDPDDSFTFDELKQMNYLHAALSESMRLYPSVPIDTKEVVADDILPDGTAVWKGSRLMYCIYSMGRMESIWGKDCREYRPERWLRSGIFIPESPFKFAVFNGGPRLCLGKEMAYLQMKSAAAAVIRNYHVALVPGHKVEYKLSLTLFMKHGLQVTLHPRRQ